MKRLCIFLVLALCAVGCSKGALEPTPEGSPAAHEVFAASFVRPTTPLTWLQPTWVLDPSNSTGLAKDGNSCLDNTHPCKRWDNVIARWGCQGNPFGCPRLSQNTTITWLSSQPAFDDPVIFRPEIGVVNGADAGNSQNGPTIVMTGTLTTGTTGAFTLTTAKNRGANASLRGTIAGISAQETFLHNTTHDSWAWIPAITGNFISQPLAAMPALDALGAPSLAGAEVDTWATSDSITAVSMPTVVVTEIAPVTSALQGMGTVHLTHLLVPENYTSIATVKAGDDRLTVGEFVQVHECDIQREVYVRAQAQSYLWSGKPTFDNVAMNGGFISGQNVALPSQLGQGMTLVAAGYVQSQAATSTGTGTIAFSGVWLDDDVIVRQGATLSSKAGFHGFNFLGAVQLLTNTVIIYEGIVDTVSNSVNGAGSNVVYGSGKLDVGRGQLLFASGAGAAAAAFTLTGGLQIQGGTVACLAVPSSGAIGACNKTISPANIDTDCGATSCCYFVPGSGSICNTGY